MMTTKDKLIHALTDYDRKQSGKRGHNPYALGIYFQRIDEVCADIERGASVRDALVRGFSGRVLDRCLRELGLSTSTINEQHGGPVCYEPVKP